MPNWTLGVCTYELTADEAGQNTGYSRVPWDQVASGFTEVSEATMDFVTNKGRLSFSAAFATKWDVFQFRCMIQPTSLAASANVFGAFYNVTDAVYINAPNPLFATNRTDTGSHHMTKWLPAVASKDFELQVKAESDTSWSIAARETFAYSWWQVLALKQI